MQTFRQFFREKREDPAFCALYEQECNVCARTVRIFEKIEKAGISIDRLAEDLDLDPNALIALKEADHCNPRMVITLCHHLSLDAPQSCPKLT